MTKRKIIRIIIAVVVLTALTLEAFRFYRLIDYDFYKPELATFVSPDSNKTAYLLWYGFEDRSLNLLASRNSSLKNIIWIGDFDGLVRFNELLWSSDSSLVSARCYVHYSFSEGTKEFLLTHGYDFESADRIVLQRDLSDLSAKELINLDSKLEHLFTQKGGQKSCVSKDNLDDYLRKLKWREWRQWRTHLNKAKEKEANN